MMRPLDQIAFTLPAHFISEVSTRLPYTKDYILDLAVLRYVFPFNLQRGGGATINKYLNVLGREGFEQTYNSTKQPTKHITGEVYLDSAIEKASIRSFFLDIAKGKEKSFWLQVNKSSGLILDINQQIKTVRIKDSLFQYNAFMVMKVSTCYLLLHIGGYFNDYHDCTIIGQFGVFPFLYKQCDVEFYALARFDMDVLSVKHDNFIQGSVDVAFKDITPKLLLGGGGSSGGGGSGGCG